MPLTAGQSLTHYEILEPLGAGAMGEVWRARDTKLEREVALKVLPDELAGDEERLLRFEREAKTIASLNHPNIASIYGVDQVGETCFLALELVPGEDLATRLARGPLPVEEALDVCRQIAEGLEAAHEAGVIHRDLKPANVRVSPDGTVKILDFGLAKAVRPGAAGDGSASSSGSGSLLRTEEGVVLGTPTHMSPEQARGKPVDRRTDIWSFGCVLYECLTGERAFGGETFSDVMAAIVSGEPEWSALPAATPARVVALLRRCLDKDPRTRLRDVGEARVALAAARDDPPVAAGTGAASSRAAWAVAFVALAVAALVVAWALTRDATSTAPAAMVPVRSLLAMGEGISDPRLSPDGRHLMVVRDGAIEVRPLDGLQGRRLAGTQGALAPFWSPDGERIGFIRGLGGGRFTVHTISIDDEQLLEVAIFDETSLGAVWMPDGRLIVALAGEGLLAVPADGGGEPVRVLAPDRERGEIDFHAPRLLSDGRTLTMVVHMRQGSGPIAAWDGDERWLLAETEGADFGETIDSPVSDHLVMVRRGTNGGLWAAPWSRERRRTTGAPRLVAPGASSPSFGPDGRLVYLSGVERLPARLRRVDATGAPVGEALSPPFQTIRDIALTSDGRRVAVMAEDGDNRDIWTFALDGPTRARLTRSPWSDYAPVWSADETGVYYAAQVLGEGGMRPVVHVVAADGSGEPVDLGLVGVPLDLSPDGSLLLIESRAKAPDGTTHHDLRVARLVDGRPGEPTDVIATVADEVAGQIAPSGDLLAYVTDATGGQEVVVRTFPENEAVVQVSIGGGVSPRWAPEGRRLLFVGVEDGRAMLYAAEVWRTPDGIHAGSPERVFAGQDAESGLTAYDDRLFDVLGEGEEFVIEQRELRGLPEVVLWEHWQAALPAPTGAEEP